MVLDYHLNPKKCRTLVTAGTWHRWHVNEGFVKYTSIAAIVKAGTAHVLRPCPRARQDPC